MRRALLEWPIALAALAALHGAAAPADAGPAKRRAQLVVEMKGFRSNRGAALVAIYRTKEGFPDQASKALRRLALPIRRGAARAVVSDLAPGTYAIGVLHDEDGDRRMKTGLFGRPLEGYGASRDARGRFGPPRFQDAAFRLPAGRRVVAPIRLVYP
jgi:uncharacterized protein (DUF2141 family)